MRRAEGSPSLLDDAHRGVHLSEACPYGESVTTAGLGEDDLPLTDWERAVDALLQASHVVAPHQLPGLIAEHAEAFGARDAIVYLADLQQVSLVPFVGSSLPQLGAVETRPVDSTIAGRCFQRVEVLSQPEATGTRLWLPLLNGTERLGVLAVTWAGGAPERGSTAHVRLTRFVSLVAELVVTKTAYGDTIVTTRRTAPMGLASEIQWGLLPPLTFACDQLVLAGALEPAYEVAGDSLDYAVDEGVARFAMFDGMGHGLRSAQLAVLAVSAYRHARRSHRSLRDTADLVDTAMVEGFGGETFATAVLAELDTGTGLLSWISAGHPEPLLLRDGQLVKTLHVEPGLPFGMDLGEDIGYRVGTEQLQPGDRVLVYTDGVTEAPSPDGHRFGEDRLADLLCRNLAAGLPAPETMRRVIRALLDHQQGHLDDDATLLLLEWETDGNLRLLP